MDVFYETNPRTGAVYAYKKETFINPETHRKNTRRIYLGRVDPETHEPLKKPETSPVPEDLEETIAKKLEEIERLQAEIARLEERSRKSTEFITKIMSLLGELE